MPFEGSLSRRISIGNSDSNHILAVTPLTTVSGRISPETLDVWDDHGVAGGFQAPLAELSVEIHAIVSYLVRALFDELDLTPDALPPELAADLHAAVYLGLREVLRSSEDALAGWRSLEQGALEPEFLALIETIAPSYGSSGVLAETLAAELLFLRDMMVDEAEVSSSGSGISGNGGLGTRAVAEARMLFVSAAAITEGRRSVGKEQLRRLRELRAAFEELLGREPKLRQGLDLVALGNIIQTHGSGDPVDLRPAVINEGLPRVAGQRLVVNVDSDSADGVITLYFGEGAPDADGPLTVCILGEFESVDFSDLADSTSEGLRLTGEWSQPRDNVLLLTLRALGDSFEETASLRLRSGTDGDTWRFTFGYDGKSEEMAVDRSQHDFESIDSHDIPASSAACAQRF
ncbi:MAG: hypothetical protein LAT50_20005 [Ectothiorhodospiraceae bacterium]|nr:hypothetical protein [Ectothiorhodospiraceae bacterium]